MVEIKAEVERPLVEDRAERHHRVVGLGIAAPQHHLRHPGGARLLGQRLGGLDALAGDAGVGTVLERRLDGMFERPGFGAQQRGRGEDGERKRDGQPTDPEIHHRIRVESAHRRRRAINAHGFRRSGRSVPSAGR